MQHGDTNTTIDQSSVPDLSTSRLSPWFTAISTDFVDPKNLQINQKGYIHIGMTTGRVIGQNELFAFIAGGGGRRERQFQLRLVIRFTSRRMRHR